MPRTATLGHRLNLGHRLDRLDRLEAAALAEQESNRRRHEADKAAGARARAAVAAGNPTFGGRS